MGMHAYETDRQTALVVDAEAEIAHWRARYRDLPHCRYMRWDDVKPALQLGIDACLRPTAAMSWKCWKNWKLVIGARARIPAWIGAMRARSWRQCGFGSGIRTSLAGNGPPLSPLRPASPTARSPADCPGTKTVPIPGSCRTLATRPSFKPAPRNRRQYRQHVAGQNDRIAIHEPCGSSHGACTGSRRLRRMVFTLDRTRAIRLRRQRARRLRDTLRRRGGQLLVLSPAPSIDLAALGAERASRVPLQRQAAARHHSRFQIARSRASARRFH